MIVINDFARILGIEIEDGMDIDDTPKGKNGSFDGIQGKVKELMREGYSATQILSQVRIPSCLLYLLIGLSSYMTLSFFIPP